jgi:alkaline phosphatase D
MPEGNFMRMTGRPLSRRRFIAGSVSTAALTTTALTWTGGIAKPYLSRATDRPLITHGVQSGDIGVDSGVVWARSDRPARMQIEIATTDSFKDIRGGAFVDTLPDSDFTAKLLLKELPAGQDIFYRIRFQDLASPTIVGEPMVGRFRTAPSDRRSISLCWSGDQAGQGWGIDESRGGMRTYATMLRNRPDFFIHSGDHIDADLVLPPEVKLANGEVWRNLVTEEKTHVAETLDDYRGNWKYNLLDKNLIAFNADIPTVSQWDDHEVLNNWWPGEPLTRAEHRRRNYHEKTTLLLSARANRAMREYLPMIEEPTEPGRVYRKISYGPLLDARHAQLPRPQRGEPRDQLRPLRLFPWPPAGRLAQARADQLARHLEGDRQRHAARSVADLRRRSQMGLRGDRSGRQRGAARPRA